MNGLSVVIPSRTLENATKSAFAIRVSENKGTSEPYYSRIIIMDDGVKWRGGEGSAVGPVPLQTELWQVVPGAKPFIFARNVNLGIAAAGSDDVIVLNDDALLETEGGFSAMQRLAEHYPKFGLISASCNNVGNTNMWRQPASALGEWRLRVEPRMVCFVAVLIPRRTIDAVGLLDERFTDYGMEDDDYCLRVRNAGLEIGIYDGCFVDHSKLKSTFRGTGGGDFKPNMRRFIEKWGVDNWGRGRAESDFADLFPSEVGR